MLIRDRADALVAAWVEHDPSSANTVDWSRLDLSTDTWSAEASIDGLVSDDASHLVLHRTPGGDLLAFWAVLDASFPELDWSRLDETTGHWTTERSVESFVDVTELAVALDPAGNTVVAWADHDARWSDEVRWAGCGFW